MTIASYKGLTVWQKSISLVENIYSITKKLPKEEVFGLTSQMRRSAVSVPSNIAEGYNRQSIGDYIRFLNIAYGSVSELETQLIIMDKLYPEIDIASAKILVEEIQKMLFVLIKKLSS